MNTPFEQVFKDGREIENSLIDYWRAPSGVGKLADEWQDKPHRLLYDLISYAVYLENKLAEVT